MYKRNFAITILDSEYIGTINKIIAQYAEITMQSSSHVYFDTQPVNHDDIVQDITLFIIESDSETAVNKKLNDLINDLDQLDIDYAIRDEDTGKMIVYVEFVAALDIKFDDIEIIREGTYKKIDELKSYKTELGICKGYKPNFRPLESHPIKDIKIQTESIYLFCHSQENLIGLRDVLSEMILEIDPDLKIGFRQFTGEDPEYRTRINDQ